MTLTLPSDSFLLFAKKHMPPSQQETLEEVVVIWNRYVNGEIE